MSDLDELFNITNELANRLSRIEDHILGIKLIEGSTDKKESKFKYVNFEEWWDGPNYAPDGQRIDEELNREAFNASRELGESDE